MKKKLLIILFFTGLLWSHAQINSVAIVGEAASGWPGSPGDPGPTDVHQMTTTDGENWSLQGLTLSTAVPGGGLKFRANNEWTINWGSDSFPNGIASQNGANILCTAGVYDVTFNSTTGVYSFTGGNALPAVRLVGSASGTALGLPMSTNNGIVYTLLNTTLLNGNVQFDIDGLFFGGDTFPDGILTEGLSITAAAAEYSSITVNIATGTYNFTFAPAPNQTITMSGSAVANLGLNMLTSDGVNFVYYNLPTTTGELYFTNNTSLETYANTYFPSGTAVLNGNSIPVPSGTWNVTFNSITQTYAFTGNANFPGISIVGDGIDGWPGSPENPGPVDLHQLSTEDGVIYTLYGLDCTVGGAKFRQDNDWALNWGDVAFPSGTGLQNGSNIEITTAGTYTVTFNRITGVYSFETPLTVAIVGTGVGGWPTDAPGEIDAHRLESTDGVHFRLNDIELTDGEIKFRQNNSWDVFWGGTSLDGILVPFGPAITTAAGTYSVIMNRITGNYSLSTPTFSNNDFKIYPNPTNNVWNFVSAKQAIESIQISDVLGKTVMTVNPKDRDVIIDASSLIPGLYFAKIATANGTETVKLIRN